MSALPWWDVWEQHLDEASFLWSMRRRGLLAPNWRLRELARHEERLLAHLDGLVLAGEKVAEQLLHPALSTEDPGLVAAAALCLVDASRAGVEEVLKRWWNAAPPSGRHFRRSWS